MRYKKLKNAQKKKNACSIPPALIASHRHEEVIHLLSQKTTLSNQDRYLYGYSLLRTNRKLESLVTLWPLVARGQTKLQTDCTIIAEHVFQDDSFLTGTPPSNDNLYTLFLAAKSLAPQKPGFRTLKYHLFNSLWEKGDYENLERALKAEKKESSSTLVENLSKLAFFQSEKKLQGDSLAFISHILTGGACLIARHSIYHNEISNAIHLLGNELKYLFHHINNKQKSHRDPSFIENFIDYETNILTHVLQLYTNSREKNSDIIPSPNYLTTHNSATGRVSQVFLPWLSSTNKALSETYRPETRCAVLWALGGDKSSSLSNAGKSFSQDHPHLRLALMLRATQAKRAHLNDIVKMSDFDSLTANTNLFRNVAINTAKSMLHKEGKTGLSNRFWELLLEFYPAIQDPELQNRLLRQFIQTLQEENKNQIPLDFEKVKDFFCRMNAFDAINVLCEQQQDCLIFLSGINSKQSKKIISDIHDEQSLRNHLTLIANCFFFTYTSLSEKFFQHIISLRKNRKINKIIFLKELIDCDSDCHFEHPECRWRFYQYEIKFLVHELSLPVARLSDFRINPDPRQSSTPASSILSGINPFKTLGVSLDDAKPVIMKKIMQLIQRSPEKMALFRNAQSALFDPALRFLNQYFRYLAEDPAEPNHDFSVPSPDIMPSLNEIPLREDLLNAN